MSSSTGTGTSVSDAQASTASQSASSTTDAPLQLWGIANSLLSEYYPSATITDVASLTWPSTALIESSTSMAHSAESSSKPSSVLSSSTSSLDVNRPLATETTASSEPEPSAVTSDESKGQPRDRKLGIALGVSFGVLSLGLVFLALFCVHRRRKQHSGTGIFPNRRRVGSPTDSEIGEWRSRHPHMGLVTTITSPMSQTQNRAPREWVERYNRLSGHPTPPVYMHPAFTHQASGSAGISSSETNPFFTPANRSTEHADYQNEAAEYHPGYPQSGFTAATVPYTPYRPVARRSQSSHRRSSTSSGLRDERNSRPPTPFSPMMMLQASSPAKQNPFTSAQDNDADDDAAERQRVTRAEQETHEENDEVSPMQPPSKSPARRSSPLIHYPSWSEVSEFDFTGESDANGRELRGKRSGNGSVDGFRRERESVVGRTELA